MHVARGAAHTSHNMFCPREKHAWSLATAITAPPPCCHICVLCVCFFPSDFTTIFDGQPNFRKWISGIEWSRPRPAHGDAEPVIESPINYGIASEEQGERHQIAVLLPVERMEIRVINLACCNHFQVHFQFVSECRLTLSFFSVVLWTLHVVNEYWRR